MAQFAEIEWGKSAQLEWHRGEKTSSLNEFFIWRFFIFK